VFDDVMKQGTVAERSITLLYLGIGITIGIYTLTVLALVLGAWRIPTLM
jgi:hypothetical protein